MRRQNSLTRDGIIERADIVPLVPPFVNKIINGDALDVLKTLQDESVDSVITSPPYFGLRDYGVKEQIGLEETPEEYVQKLTEVFREMKRILKKEGTFWLNLGDSYATAHKSGTTDNAKGWTSKNTVGKRQAHHGRANGGNLPGKNLLGIPWRVAFALQTDGWYLRQDIIWAKPNPMPESVTDRCTKAHEYVFLLTKSPIYYYDNEAIKEPAIYGLHSKEKRPQGIVRDRLYGYDSKEAILRGRIVNQTKNGITVRHPNGKHHNTQQSPKTIVDYRNRRSVWTVTTKPFKGAHFATFPEALIEPMVLVGCPKGGLVLDPFFGAGTTGVVAKKLGRNYLGIELNKSYCEIARKRIDGISLPLL